MQVRGFAISSARLVKAIMPRLEKAMCILEGFADYDIELGGFVVARKVRGRRKQIGEPAGTLAYKRGKATEVRISLGNVSYTEHQLLWVWFTGSWLSSPLEIDHINQNPFDNRVGNLRAATHLQNSQNQRQRNSNTSGHTGVFFVKRTGGYFVEITHNYQKHYGGYYKTLEEAIAARDSLRTMLNSYGATFTGNHGNETLPRT